MLLTPLKRASLIERRSFGDQWCRRRLASNK